MLNFNETILLFPINCYNLLLASRIAHRSDRRKYGGRGMIAAEAATGRTGYAKPHCGQFLYPDPRLLIPVPRKPYCERSANE
ncbi:unnamed protein product, partial [Iphiclides podalirius]